MPITSWSVSRVNEFEKCPYRAFLLHDQRVPEPQRPLPPGKLEHANDRGTRVHDGCEQYVRGLIPAPPPEAMKHFADEMLAMRNLFSHGVVSLEGEWGMNRAWEPWDWNGRWIEVVDRTDVLIDTVFKTLPDRGKPGQVVQVGKLLYTWVPAWLRLKLDALVFVSKTEAVAIDYKTGKKWGNEIKHGEQLQLYQLVTFLRYPELEKITTELWYLDVEDITSQAFTRSQGLRFQRSWEKRGNALTTCQEFPPKPSLTACKWCMYGQWGTGHCQVGKR